MLATYPGTILVVSHDRDFLDRIATSILFAEGDGTWTEYAGGYSDMVRQRGAGHRRGGGGDERRRRRAEGGARGGAERKLSYKDQRALDALPGQIEALAEQARASWRRSSPRPRAATRCRRSARNTRGAKARDRGGGGGMAAAGDAEGGDGGEVDRFPSRAKRLQSERGRSRSVPVAPVR